jgi:hypothetical protein
MLRFWRHWDDPSRWPRVRHLLASRRSWGDPSRWPGYRRLLEVARYWGDTSRWPRYRQTRSIFLRGLGIAYLAAFGSIIVQIDGLIGSRGILPAAEFLARAQLALGARPSTYWRLPTLFWLDASDAGLHALCWGGLLLSAALVSGLLPSICTVFLWLFYLSITVVGQVFLGYQWDGLLLETGLLAILLVPWGVRLGRARDEPWWVTVWLMRWLVFRLMFLSGMVKLGSHDPTWSDWRALEYHYETQPLPTWTSWYIHQMPPWFHWLSVGVMFYAELIAPFFMFGPRPMRLVGFTSMVFLQLLIAGTGNYGCFNLLAVVLCLSLLDDRDWQWMARWVRKPVWDEITDVLELRGAGAPWPLWRRVIAAVLGGILFLATLGQSAERLWPASAIPSLIDFLGVGAGLEPLRSTNTYGLFAVMTTMRPEITLEGSDDGVDWKAYRFRWKPCELNRRPLFTTPHMPRLDWQLWFAALAGDCRSQPWFLRFEQRLLEGAPEVLGLLRENPFPTHAPRYVRARLDEYTFTSWGATDWWRAEDAGLFCPPLALRSSE